MLGWLLNRLAILTSSVHPKGSSLMFGRRIRSYETPFRFDSTGLMVTPVTNCRLVMFISARVVA